MITDIYTKDIPNLYSTPILQQTAFWSIVKNKLGVKTMAIDYKSKEYAGKDELYSNETINSDLLLIIQQINNRDTIAYVPYGPEFEPQQESQGAFLEELSECIKSKLPGNCLLIRYDLCWESYWAKDKQNFDINGNWLGEPEVYSQEIRFNFNTVKGNFRRAYSNILPSNTIYIDLKPDLSTILAKMKPKTRYNINLSLRKGVTVRKAGLRSIDIWYELYKETASRNGIFLNDIKYFEALLSARADNTNSPAEVHLLIADVEKTPAASMFLIISAHRAFYLYGASSILYKNYMPSYALQWEAIKIAKDSGCTEYDMFGIAPNHNSSHPLHGLYKFKTGFGGSIYHGLGCWDYPLNNEKYDNFKNSEITNQGFHVR